MKTNEEMLKTKWLFKTTEELAEFVRGFEEQQGKTLEVSYFKLTAVLRDKKENRTVDQESDRYIDREMGTRDTITEMKMAESKRHRNDTAWMIKQPIIKTEKGD
jgi:hypothetical protein|tara:strand:+ start:70 stop:381 length:312 start_codon:yes stop_codon:yes gene_type:complete